MRRQLRRIQSIHALGVILGFSAFAVLTTAPPEGWFNTVMLLGVFVYLTRKGTLIYRAARARQQLRLEEQFLRHGPSHEQVLTCLRSAQHLWHSSLILKALKGVRRQPTGARSPEESVVLMRAYRRAFRRLRPSRWPVGGFGTTALFLVWLEQVPDALIYTSPVLLSAALLLALMGVEVVLAVLRADLRRDFEAWTELLVEWTLSEVLNDVIQPPPKRYRHTSLYNPKATKPLPPPSGGDGHMGTPVLQEKGR